MAWNDDRRHVILHLPTGVQLQDLKELLDGYSKALGMSSFSVESIPGSFGLLNEHILLPAATVLAYEASGSRETTCLVKATLSMSADELAVFARNSRMKGGSR